MIAVQIFEQVLNGQIRPDRLGRDLAAQRFQRPPGGGGDLVAGVARRILGVL